MSGSLWEKQGLSLFWVRRWALLGGFIALLVILFFPRELPKYDLRPGGISTQEIDAPISFPVLKTEEVLAWEQQEAARKVLLVVDEDTALTTALVGEPARLFEKLQRIRRGDEFFNQKKAVLESWGMSLSSGTISLLLGPRLPDRLQQEISRSVRDILRQGVLPSGAVAERDRGEEVLFRRGGLEAKLRLSVFVASEELLAHLSGRAQEAFPGNAPASRAYIEITRAILRPNLIVNEQEAERLRDEARQSVSPYQGWIDKGERIIGQGERINAEHVQKIRSLEAAQSRIAYGGSGFLMLLPILSRGLLAALMLLTLGMYLAVFRPREFSQGESLLTLSGVTLLQILLFKAVTLQDVAPIYLIPLPSAAILVTMLFDFQLGIVLTAILTVLLAGLSGLPLSFVLVVLLGSSAAAFSVRNLRHRSEFLRTMLVLAVANVLSIGALELMRLLPLGTVGENVGAGVLQAFLSVGLATLSLPVFEHAFGVATLPSLLELADFNRPLLKRLSVEAPGTYQHSLLVARLAEAGCEAIGADSLLSRVAAYYHDIGKIAKPEYFIENQIGIRNRHDKLSPKMSSLVLISHVREGVNLARKERLPQTIRAGIEQHHGTSLLTYFYHKAKRLANPSEEEVFEGDYRYPGPKPQRREFGVIMLADAVEAASRVLRDPTPGRLQDLARKLVMDKFNEMELDDCNLTLRDLHRIGESFLPVLVAFFHPRLDYPQEEGNEGRHRKDGSRGHPGETPEEAHREGPSAGRTPEH